MPNRKARMLRDSLKDIEKAKKKNLSRKNPRSFESEEEAMAERDKLEDDGIGEKLSVMYEDGDKWIVTDDLGEGVVILCEDGDFRPYPSQR